MYKERIELGRMLIAHLARVMQELRDEDVKDLFDPDTVNGLLKAILDPSRAEIYPSIFDFLLANKERAALLSRIRDSIRRKYTFKQTYPRAEVFYLVHSDQWFDDGVMFLSSEGGDLYLISLYRNGEISYAIAARDFKAGEEVGPDAFEFISVRNLEEYLNKIISPEQISDLEQPLRELKILLDSKTNDESAYQEWLHKYPWILGIQYSQVQRHLELDDKNIPDFTGVKVKDQTRDIIEIKPPYAKLFLKNGDFIALRT